MTAERFVPVSDWSDDRLAQLVDLYAHEWWTQGRTEPDVRRMLDSSDVVVAFVEPATNRLAAFARALTDDVYKALVFDVIVAESFRDTGLGRQLMDAVLDHPRVRSVRHVELYCRPELREFYQRWGFADATGEVRLMRRIQSS